MSTDTLSSNAAIVSPEDLLDHWQGHRRLTRRVIDAFPEDKLFSFSIGSMRPFGKMAIELLTIAVPTVRGGIHDTWESIDHDWEVGKDELLAKWDEATQELDELWPKIKPERFQEEVMAFGRYSGKYVETVFYVIDNEVHHRGQGYVYLRALGVEPPYFWER